MTLKMSSSTAWDLLEKEMMLLPLLAILVHVILRQLRGVHKNLCYLEFFIVSYVF
jgi:hypothetical protein